MNAFESASMTLKNGMTLLFQDGGARKLIDALTAKVKNAYSPDNPPPYPVTSVDGKTGDVGVLPAGGATDKVLKKASATDYDVTWGDAAARNTWYATCTTAAGTSAKVATTATGDFVLATGNMVRILFSDTNIQPQPTLSVDGSTPKSIKNITSDSNITTNLWRAGEVIDVVYDGTEFVVVDGGLANGTYYGRTKLSNSTSSSSQTIAATSKAVKDAYDLADTANTLASAAYSASNPPPYPVTSVNNQTGAVTTHDIPSGGSANDALLKDSATDYDVKWGSIFDLVYPVGAIYMSTVSTSPASLFGGTWEQIKDTFILAAGDTYTAGDTGGEAAHTLIESELAKISGTVRHRSLSYNGSYMSPFASTSGVFTSNRVGSTWVGAYANVNADVTDLKMNFGGDGAHNNMPPYLVAYMWKRVA